MVFFCLLFGCGPRSQVLVAPAAAATFVAAAVPAGAVTDHVVVVSIDGLRPDAIGLADAPTLQRLIQQGAVASVARTILPSTTLPSHTSMLTGLPPADHGVTWNSAEVDPWGTVGVQTVFEIAHARGFRTAAFFGKAKLQYLRRKGSLDAFEAPGRKALSWRLARTVAGVERHLDRNRPNLLVVHFGEPDYAGHGTGWMSPTYLRAVADADFGVGRILAAADRAFGPDRYTLIVTADHGGHNQTHGSADSLDVTIPWIVWGAGVRPGTVLADTVRTMDTAATILWLLGVLPPESWTGTPQVSAFTSAANQKANTAAHP